MIKNNKIMINLKIINKKLDIPKSKLVIMIKKMKI